MKQKQKGLRALYIDAKNRQILEIKNTGLKSLQACVEGYIETAHEFPNGDVLFVNEEGLLQSFEYGFGVFGSHVPYFAGSGVIVGACDDEGDDRAAKSTIDDIEQLVSFCKLVKADSA